MFEKILVGHDSSEVSQKAFEVALDIAKKYGSEVVVVHVIDTRSIPNIPHMDVIIRPLKERAEKLEKLVKETFEREGIKGKFVLREGSPVDEIAKLAEEENADLVVVGSRGLGNVSGYLLGSVSTKLVITCKKNVLVVKPQVAAASKL